MGELGPCLIMLHVMIVTVRYLPLSSEYVEDEVSVYTRTNMDSVVIAQGQRMIDICKMCNLRIMNGRFWTDEGIGKYTCHTYNGSSTVDYYLCSHDLFQFVYGFYVKDVNMYSDHCPISLEINSLRLPTQRVAETVVTKMVWDVEKVREYQHYLSTGSSVKFNEMVNIIERQTGDNLTSSVNDAVVAFTDGIRLAADPLFLKRFNCCSLFIFVISDKAFFIKYMHGKNKECTYKLKAWHEIKVQS